MRTLIIVRHGRQDSNGDLSVFGRLDVGVLADRLTQNINGASTIRILTSPAEYALATAAILGSALRADEVRAQAILRTKGDGKHNVDLLGAVDLIHQNTDVDVLILVTHSEYTTNLPSYFFMQEWHLAKRSHYIDKNEAWLINMDTKEMMHIW